MGTFSTVPPDVQSPLSVINGLDLFVFTCTGKHVWAIIQTVFIQIIIISAAKTMYRRASCTKNSITLVSACFIIVDNPLDMILKIDFIWYYLEMMKIEK